MDDGLMARCEVIYEFQMRCRPDDRWAKFFEIYDIGIPLAVFVAMEWATPTYSGTSAIEDAWEELCRIVDVDPDGDYDSFDDTLQKAGSGQVP